MPYTVTYVDEDELHLNKPALILLLQLNTLLPDSNGVIWATADEIVIRLIHCGVNPSLSLGDLERALKFRNKGQLFFAQRRLTGVFYYRPTKFDKHSPEEQRNVNGVAVNLLPRLNWFNTSNATVQDEEVKRNLSVVNSDLHRCLDLKRRIQTKEYTCE